MNATAVLDLDEPQSPERDLWLAVLGRAIDDALGRSGAGRGADDLQGAALAWFRDAGADYEATCILAGADPAELRRRVLAGEIAGLAFLKMAGRPRCASRCGPAGC